MSEDNVLICANKEEVPIPPVPSQSYWCMICACDLWVSNTMVRHVLRGARPHCLACAQGLMEMEPNSEIVLLPEQHQELREHGVLNEVKDFVRRMNEK